MCYQNYSDYELVNEFLGGKQSAIEVLIKRHKRKVYTYIVINVKDRELAEDIFQDTFIKVINSLTSGRYKDEGKFLSWVMRIAHNLVIDHFRKAKQLQTVSNDASEIDLFSSSQLLERNIEQEIISEQIVKEVRSLIEFLPEDQKEVVVLRHYVGLSFKEIADHTGVSINTALGRMRYALINLRKLIEEKNLVLTDI
ncbi:MAG TPA: RNA polymerase subunit sigma-24 [Bacteroidales bacterium]|nr:MAG: RNA polymerase subunit sigma-24 [Bacteroidetes bacterium GWF2_33_38]OFY86696.1 MAG: RNA polymerase subunit sigma-24 [Bacteroidetes bacterium RIFOXYA2_FULL_33_7]HBF87819.1 RNA polymerase subunit sigma-24 [Bacteroidales bacterium]